MVKKNLLLPLFLIFLTGSVIGGYMAWQANRDSESVTPESDQDTVNAGLAGLSEVTTGSAAFQFDLSSLPVGSEDAISARLKGTLDFDTTDTDRPLSLLNMDAIVETAQGTASYEDLAFLRSAQQMFFSLNNLSLERPTDEVLGTTEDYDPKWYEVSSDRDPLSIFPYLSSLGVLGTDIEQSFDVPALQRALVDTTIFEQVTQMGDETVDNVDTYHYSFSGLNREQASLLITQLSQTTAADATAITELQNQLQEFDLTGEIWISKSENVLKKIKLDVTPATGDTGITLGFTINLTDLDQPVTIPQVQDAGDFDTFITTMPALETPAASDTSIEELTSEDTLEQLQ